MGTPIQELIYSYKRLRDMRTLFFAWHIVARCKSAFPTADPNCSNVEQFFKACQTFFEWQICIPADHNTTQHSCGCHAPQLDANMPCAIRTSYRMPHRCVCRKYCKCGGHLRGFAESTTYSEATSGTAFQRSARAQTRTSALQTLKPSLLLSTSAKTAER